jgi:cobalt-zinc-cadmium efflux system outer membrane protein
MTQKNKGQTRHSKVPTIAAFAAALLLHAAASTVHAEISAAVSLPQAIQLALEHNPRLATFSWELKAREARVSQAGLLPNPELSFEIENFAGSNEESGFGASEQTLRISQLIELGGKRSKRRQLAGHQRDASAWAWRAARIETLAEVERAFVAVLAAQERLALAEELAAVGKTVLRTVEKQLLAGAVSSIEKYRAEVSLAASLIALQRYRAELASARKQLAATWGSGSDAYSRADGKLRAAPPPLPPLARLQQLAEQAPAIARWESELAQRRSQLALAESLSTPDLTLTAGPRWSRESDSRAFVFELSAPLPIFDRNRSGTLEAQRRLAKAVQEQRAASLRARTDLATAYESLASTRAAVISLRDEVLPLAHNAFEGATTAYRRGVYGYLELVDARKTLFSLRSQYIDTLAAYRAATVEVELLVGSSLEEIGSNDRRS